MHQTYWSHPLLAATPHGFGLKGSLPTPDFFPFAKAGVHFLKQVHGVGIVTVEEESLADPPLEGDALVSSKPGVILGIRTADCAPILMVHRSGWTAAVHAGWRSAAGGILDRVLDHLVHEKGLDPSGFSAVIGPCIGAVRFEVGLEVLEAFGEAGRPYGRKGPFRDGKERYFFDLPAFLMGRLSARGISRAGFTGGCTVADPGRFWSFRREAASAGRQVSLITVPPAH